MPTAISSEQRSLPTARQLCAPESIHRPNDIGKNEIPFRWSEQPRRGSNHDRTCHFYYLDLGHPAVSGFHPAVRRFPPKSRSMRGFVEGAKGGFPSSAPHHPIPGSHPGCRGDVAQAPEPFSCWRNRWTRCCAESASREILPLAIMRPLSGSGSLGIVTELVKAHGPDSFIARLASNRLRRVTETTFYVLAVYFGAVGIKKARHAVVAGVCVRHRKLDRRCYSLCRLVFAVLTCAGPGECRRMCNSRVVWEAVRCIEPKHGRRAALPIGNSESACLLPDLHPDPTGPFARTQRTSMLCGSRLQVQDGRIPFHSVFIQLVYEVSCIMSRLLHQSQWLDFLRAGLAC